MGVIENHCALCAGSHPRVAETGIRGALCLRVACEVVIMGKAGLASLAQSHARDACQRAVVRCSSPLPPMQRAATSMCTDRGTGLRLRAQGVAEPRVAALSRSHISYMVHIRMGHLSGFAKHGLSMAFGTMPLAGARLRCEVSLHAETTCTIQRRRELSSAWAASSPPS